MRSDSWFYEVFRQWPDLIVRFLGGEKAEPGKKAGYRFEAPVLKEGEQRLDGVLVPPVETAERPVVNLEDLSRRQGLDPLEEMLTLVVRPEGELGPTSQQLVGRKPELSAMIATILWKRLPSLSLEEIMAIAGIQLADLSETRAYQDILAKGRQEGREEGLEEGLEQGGQREAASLVIRLLRRRFGRVSAEDAATIGGLSTAALEELAMALLEFESPVELQAWLVNCRGD